VSGITVDEVTKRVENTVYTAVGLGILGFQHLQVQRRELRRSLDAVLRQVADAAGRTSGDH
jgi:predicted urease superfamily metal-dependent hydrolase